MEPRRNPELANDDIVGPTPSEQKLYTLFKDRLDVYRIDSRQRAFHAATVYVEFNDGTRESFTGFDRAEIGLMEKWVKAYYPKKDIGFILMVTHVYTKEYLTDPILHRSQRKPALVIYPPHGRQIVVKTFKTLKNMIETLETSSTPMVKAWVDEAVEKDRLFHEERDRKYRERQEKEALDRPVRRTFVNIPVESHTLYAMGVPESHKVVSVKIETRDEKGQLHSYEWVQ